MPTSSAQRPSHFARDVVPEWPRAPRPSAVNNNQLTNERRSIGGRIFRTLARFFIAVLIGLGATLAWQSYGDEAREMVGTRAPSLAWLLPVSTTKSTPDDQGSTAATSAELVQQLKPLTLDLAIVRQSVEQLAAKIEQLGVKQEQMVQNIATLQAIDQDITQKVSSPLHSPAAASPRKPSQPTAQSSSVPPQTPPSGPPLRLLDGPAQSAR
jgi:TolA-binding protein